MKRQRSTVLILVLFVGLMAVMTWPQAAHLSDRAVVHQDIYFNMWRLEWFAHALATHPGALLDGNIFYPEHRTLTLSDAMFVEGAVAAPLIWARLPPLLVHNIVLYGAIVASALGMFMLVRHLTASRGAAVLAAVIFAFAPYRFEHIMHLELQWTVWMPWAFWALHRTLETGRLRFGVLTGAMVALQMLSSIYYGIFLATLLSLVAGLLLIRDRAVPFMRAALPLAAGAALALTVCGLYAQPYLRTRDAIGERSADQIAMFSARPSSYLVATPTNWLYGRMFQSRGRLERRLFPGAIAVLLAMIGLLLDRPSDRRIAYLLALVLAFETSLGFSGYAYRFFYDHVAPYRGLRALSRLGIFVVLFLGVLAGYGYAALSRSLRQPGRRVLFGVLFVGILAEYHVTLDVAGVYANTAPALYRFLARQPRGVVAEFPAPRPYGLPGEDPRYTYLSTFHWFPLVNGYSGVYPPSYLQRLERLKGFPDERSLRQLHADTVRYVIVHSPPYEPVALARVLSGILDSNELAQLGSFSDGEGTAYLFVLK